MTHHLFIRLILTYELVMTHHQALQITYWREEHDSSCFNIEQRFHTPHVLAVMRHAISMF